MKRKQVNLTIERFNGYSNLRCDAEVQKNLKYATDVDS